MGQAKRRRELGDGPVQAEFRGHMEKLAMAIDMMFNGDLRRADRKTGFVLMVFPFSSEDNPAGLGERCNFITNADRDDVRTLMKEMITRIEGQAEVQGSA